MLENPMLLGRYNEDKYLEVNGTCTHCDEDIYQHEGIEFEGELFCGSSCLGDHLIAVGAAIERSELNV